MLGQAAVWLRYRPATPSSGTRPRLLASGSAYARRNNGDGDDQGRGGTVSSSTVGPNAAVHVPGGGHNTAPTAATATRAKLIRADGGTEWPALGAIRGPAIASLIGHRLRGKRRLPG